MAMQRKNETSLREASMKLDVLMNEIVENGSLLEDEFHRLGGLTNKLQQQWRYSDRKDHLNEYLVKLYDAKERMNRVKMKCSMGKDWEKAIRRLYGFLSKRQVEECCGQMKWIQEMKMALKGLPNEMEREEEYQDCEKAFEDMVVKEIGEVQNRNQLEMAVLAYGAIGKVDWFVEEWRKSRNWMHEVYGKFELWNHAGYLNHWLECWEEDWEVVTMVLLPNTKWSKVEKIQFVMQLVAGALMEKTEEYRSVMETCDMEDRVKLYMERIEFGKELMDGMKNWEVEKNKVWEHCVLPFRDFIVHYGEIEHQYILANCNSQIHGMENNENDEMKVFGNRLKGHGEYMKLQIHGAVDRCTTMSDGIALPMLVEGIRNAIAKHASVLGQVCAKPEIGNTMDWDRVHHTLEVLGKVGEMESNLIRLDKAMKVHVREQLRSILDSVNDPNTPAKLTSTIARNVYAKEDMRIKDRLRALYTASTDAEKMLFVDESTLTPLRRPFQRLCYESIFCPMRTLLCNNLQIPQQEQIQDDSLPTINPLPQDAVTTAADVLLSLLPQLESLTENENAKHIHLASNQIQHLAVQEWKSLAQHLDLPTELFLATLETTTNSWQSMPTVDLWTNTIAMAILGVYISQLLVTSHFSPSFITQLDVDITYLQNVFNALGTSESSFLQLFHKLLLSEISILKEDVQSHRSLITSAENVDTKIKFKLERLIGRKRGIIVDYSDE